MLDIPVFHDDQHGTAIVVLGALRNALRVVGKEMNDCRIVVCGVGAAGSAIIRLLLPLAPADLIAVDVDGIVHPDREGLHAEPGVGRRAHQPGEPHRDAARRDAPAPTSSSGSRRRTCSRRVRRRRDGRRARSCSRWPTPTPRSTRRWRSGTRRSSPPGGRTTRTRSTTSSPSPASSAGCSTPRPGGSPTTCCSPPSAAIADVVAAAQPVVHRAQRLRQHRRPGGGRRGAQDRRTGPRAGCRVRRRRRRPGPGRGDGEGGGGGR